MRRHTATGSAETTPQDAPVGRARYGVFALAAGLLIVAAVVGLLLTQTGRGQVQATATTPAVTANPGSGGDALPPGPVTVKATRADSHRQGDAGGRLGNVHVVILRGLRLGHLPVAFAGWASHRKGREGRLYG